MPSSFRPSQLPELSRRKNRIDGRSIVGRRWTLWAVAITSGALFALATSTITRLHPVAAVMMGIILATHSGLIFVARLRYREWVGLTGFTFSCMVLLLTAAGAGLADPLDLAEPAAGYLTAHATQTDLLLEGLNTIASNVLPWIAAIGGLLHSNVRINDFKPH